MATEVEPLSTDTTVWVGHPSHWHYFWWWVLGIVLVPVVIGLFIIGWIFLDRARRTYSVTERKVIIEWGLVAKSSNEVRVKDIRSINLRKSGLVGLLGVGDLEFSSAASDKAEIIFGSVADATEVRDIVRKFQERDAG